MSLITIYARPKVGKTTMALKGAPKNKTLVISSDQGLIGIDTDGLNIEEDVSIKNLRKLPKSPAARSASRIVIDTASSLYAEILSELAGGGTPTLQQRGIANNEFATLLRELRNLKKDVIILAQEKMVMPTEDWISDDDDEEVAASVTVDLPQGAHNVLMQMSDCIGRLYIANVNDKMVRRLWLTSTPNINAGARSKTYTGQPPYLKSPSIARLNELLGWGGGPGQSPKRK